MLFLFFLRGHQNQTMRVLLIFFFCAICCCAPLHTTGAADYFPMYPIIEKNVLFWEAIYSRYTTRQGVLHDANDLGKIYSVIQLVDWDYPGAARVNGALINRKKEWVKNLLEDLEAGKPPRTAEARRIAALFPHKRQTAFHQARDNIRLQLGQKDRFLEGIIRSGRYIIPFKKIFKAHGLPQELAYLPHVESSYNPKAHSKAGAAGLWQFTRSTGSDYLVINSLVDERFDPFLATEAAARLLQKNYQSLGTWPLAITAYNYGRAGMLRAACDKGSYEKIFESYDQGYFKFASRNFYSEFLAALRVAKRLEGNPTLRSEPPEKITSFRLQRATDLNRLCTLTGISKEHFLRLNPALQKPVIRGEKAVPPGYLVRKPAPKKMQKVLLAQKPLPKNPIIRYQQHASNSLSSHKIPYVVKKGDTISSIARKLRVPPKTILAANNHRSTVQIGVKLLIPQKK